MFLPIHRPLSGNTSHNGNIEGAVTISQGVMLLLSDSVRYARVLNLHNMQKSSAESSSLLGKLSGLFPFIFHLLQLRRNT